MSGRGCRVYIGNLPKDCREKDIDRCFRTFGRIRDILVKTGYGFVEFDDHRDADDAVYDMDGRDLLGERITVEIARGTRRERSRDRRRGSRAPWMDKYGPPTRTKYRVTVENLSTRVSWQDLKDLMRRAGEVCYADAHKDRRNEGVVEFLSRSDMERAIEKYDGHEMNGRRIKLVDETRGGGSRSRSRSRRSRSRSRSKRREKRSRSKSRDKRSRSKDRSREKSKGKSSRKSRDKSRSKDKSRDRSRDKSRDRSRDRSRDKSRNKSEEKSKIKSESRERSKEDDKKDSRENSKAKSRSRSRSRSKSGSRSDAGGSKSRSGSPRENGNMSEGD